MVFILFGRYTVAIEHVDLKHNEAWSYSDDTRQFARQEFSIQISEYFYDTEAYGLHIYFTGVLVLVYISFSPPDAVPYLHKLGITRAGQKWTEHISVGRIFIL